MRRLALSLTLAACGAEPILPDEVEDVDVAPSATARAQESPSSPPRPSEPAPAGAQSFEAVVEAAKVPDDTPGLVFRGTTLRRNGAPRPIVVTYAKSAVWSALDGARVRVLGVPYQPEGRAIGGEHFEILEAHLVDPSAGATVLGFGRKQTLRGRLARVIVHEGQKGEGSSYLTFKPASGLSFEVFELSRELAAEPPLDVELEVEAHQVELSATMQRRGGPFLWIRSAKR
jgi:hypothetical protein